MSSHGSRFPPWLRALALLGVAPLGIASLALASSAQQPAATTPIKHIVVLYLENHSFDSILGYWCDAHAGRCPVGGMPSSVRLADGVTVKPKMEPDIVPAVDHSVASQQLALANEWDKIQGCSKAAGYACIGGYKPFQIPNATSLATTFAINDNTFSMADSPSWGGHLYAVMGQTDGFTGDNPTPTSEAKPGPGWGCNSSKEAPWAPSVGAATQMIPSCVPDPSLNKTQFPFGGAFEQTPASYALTIMDRLNAAKLSWKIYGDPNGTTNGKTTPGYIWDTCPSIAECLDTSQSSHNAMSSNFAAVAKKGSLPNFSLVVPAGPTTARDSEHNGTSITAGDDWIGQIAKAIMTGPEWSSTALFITWDDCGCFYDQAKPGTNPDDTQQGPRSPLIIVSPYAKPGFTDPKHATFVSILAYVEHTFGLRPMGKNDTGAYAFANAFNYSQTPIKPIPMVWRKWPKDAYHLDQAELDQDT
jgi:phospholipase C